MLRLSLAVLALAAASGLEDPTDPVGTPRSAHLHRAYVQGSTHQADELSETGWGAPILVGTHHKTGTVLLAKIFRVAAKYMGVPRLKEAQTTNRTQCGKYFVGKLPVAQLRLLRWSVRGLACGHASHGYVVLFTWGATR